ncbi:uncharacterized protein LOC116029732 [Ipomoea triloba]|uniref:uncharacterized protein LOC116029732 n=1 Tax=Ipomoea triloba TaxID=35885 RepID=UPI00125E5A2F|nr:uncharacterized protein LOC116029732 [Ipomoea triloba]
MGGKIDSTQNQGNSPPIFKLHGQNFHLIGSLLPVQGERPKFAQLYIYETQNEVRNWIHSVRWLQRKWLLRQDILHATINASYLWRYCKVLRLTKNMRLQNSTSNNDYAQLKQFSKWIAKIGDGKIEGQTDECEYIEIPGHILLQYSTDPIKAIVESTYPSFSSIIDDPSYLQNRAILAPTLDMVHSINEYMSSLNTSEGSTYLSCDSTCKSDSNFDMLVDVHTLEFLNGIKCSGVPNHALTLKVDTPVMLLRNIDHSIGLCNGTRMVITKLGNYVLEARVLSGSSACEKVLIPRMSLTPLDLRLPFKFEEDNFH